MPTNPPENSEPGTRRGAPTTTRLRVRPARPSELALLVRHRRRMFEAIGGFLPDDLAAADPVYRRWLRTRLATGRAAAVVGELRGRVVGSAIVWLREDQPRPGAPRLRVPYVLSVFVEPAFRGRGVARRLTAWTLAWSAARGYPRTVLHASRFGRSVYASLGFERTWEMRYGGSHRRGPEGRRPLDELPGTPGGPRRRRAASR